MPRQLPLAVGAVLQEKFVDFFRCVLQLEAHEADEDLAVAGAVVGLGLGDEVDVHARPADVVTSAAVADGPLAEGVRLPHGFAVLLVVVVQLQLPLPVTFFLRLEGGLEAGGGAEGDGAVAFQLLRYWREHDHVWSDEISALQVK
jgi:hypothetical protein